MTLLLLKYCFDLKWILPLTIDGATSSCSVDIGFELPLQSWFDFKIPKPLIKNNFIENCINTDTDFITRPASKIIWLGNLPLVEEETK